MGPGQAAPPAVHAHGLVRRFGSHVAVDRVDLTVRHGEILALLGPNGAGKTTTVRMLAGLLRPDAGHAVVAGFDVAVHPDDVRRRVGLMTDVPGVYPDMEVRAYLRWFGRLYGLSTTQALARTDELIDQFGLAKWSHAMLFGLSRGTQQRVALARCLLHDPEVMLLDEPTASLNVEATMDLRTLLTSLRRDGKAMILCTHNLAEAERVADTVAILIAGRCVYTQLLAAAQTVHLVRVDVVSPDGLDLSEVAGIPAVESDSIHLEGTRLSFVSNDARQSNPALVALLVRSGCGVVQVTSQGQSLEAVYLDHLTGPGRCAPSA